MTGFDVIAILVILASAAAGWVRGGTREIITLLSFVLAAFIALVALPLTAPLGRMLVDPDWIGTIAAAIVSFLAIYFGIRIFGSILSKRAQAHPRLGGI
ncbi:MAG TPA: CvpA family protein, partial [Brevundimonas sp.]|nr:CvpA family protein [Brevundimonas sp.]